MRLITKTTLLYLILALIVFGISGIVTLRMVKDTVRVETDWALKSNLRMLEESIAAGNPLNALQNRKVQISKISPYAIGQDSLMISDTLVMHLKRMEPFRKLTVTKYIEGERYHISIMDVFIESNDMYNGVFRIMSRLFIFLSVVLLLFNFLISKWLFQPFQKTLDQISLFNLKREERMELPSTSTTEFKQLNNFIEQMTAKAQKDYQSLKEFSENASHELQTPLAIATGKLDLLLDHGNLNEEQVPLLSQAQDSLHKLSRLGKALGLLTKIENEEFATQELTNFSAIVTRTVTDFEEFAKMRALKVQSQIQQSVQLPIDPVLADILITNLMKNAIQHNIEEGWINIYLDKSKLEVKNSGKQPNITPNQLFERFRKNNQSSNSLGLGLAIVKKICMVNNFSVKYNYSDPEHLLKIQFN